MEPLKEVILNNSNLIYSIASKFKNCDIDDLFQAGCIGMVEAYRKFDSSRGVKFTTFAYPYILGRICECARENQTIKLSKDMHKLKKKIEKAYTYLAQEVMRQPTLEELSCYLNVPLDNLKLILSYQGEGYSLDNFYDDLSLYDVIGMEIDFDSLVYIKEEIDKLSEPEKTIMYQRYFEDLTQSEIASNLGLTQVDVSRREKKVLTKLRQSVN